HQICSVVLNGSSANSEIVRNLLVGASRHETLEHIALAVRQTREAALDVTALSPTLLLAIASIERRPYGGEEDLVLERFFQKINGAQSHRFHGEGDIPVSGDDDHRGSDLELL